MKHSIGNIQNLQLRWCLSYYSSRDFFMYSWLLANGVKLLQRKVLVTSSCTCYRSLSASLDITLCIAILCHWLSACTEKWREKSSKQRQNFAIGAKIKLVNESAAFHLMQIEMHGFNTNSQEQDDSRHCNHWDEHAESAPRGSDIGHNGKQHHVRRPIDKAVQYHSTLRRHVFHQVHDGYTKTSICLKS